MRERQVERQASHAEREMARQRQRRGERRRDREDSQSGAQRGRQPRAGTARVSTSQTQAEEEGDTRRLSRTQVTGSRESEPEVREKRAMGQKQAGAGPDLKGLGGRTEKPRRRGPQKPWRRDPQGQPGLKAGRGPERL